MVFILSEYVDQGQTTVKYIKQNKVYSLALTVVLYLDFLVLTKSTSWLARIRFIFDNTSSSAVTLPLFDPLFVASSIACLLSC